MAEPAGRLLSKQQQLQRMIERSLDNFRKIGRNNLTPAKIRSRLTTLKETWAQFIIGHSDLTKTISEESQGALSYFKDCHFEATEEVYQGTVDYMAECLEEIEPLVSLNTSTAPAQIRSEASTFSLSHLPPIQLPPFDGKYEDWENFRDRFTALIINNHDLRNFARMHFLTSCLKGSALDCIKDIPITAENFNIAWHALISRFENKRRLLGVHLSALLNLPGVTREASTELRSLIDKVNLSLSSLHNLPRTPEDLWQDMLVHIIVQKLDSATRKAWNIKSCDTDVPPSYDALIHFITSRARALEEFSSNSNNKAQSKQSGVSKVHAATASAAAYSPSSCPVCKERHFFSACPTFVGGNPSRRRELVKRYKRCFNCLSQSHPVRECTSKYSCRICSQKHHTMLHTSPDTGAKSPIVDPSPDTSSSSTDSPAEVQTLLASTAKVSRVQILLATAWITIREPAGRSVTVRALLDQGSEMTFISENVAQLLRVQRIRMPVAVSAVGGIHAGTVQHAARVYISPRNALNPTVSTTALILKKLTNYAPKHAGSISSLAHLKQLQLADDDPTSSDPIQVIIGADLYADVLLQGIKKGNASQPMAQQTIFGWIVSGPFASGPDNTAATVPEANASSQSCVTIAVHHCAQSSDLVAEIRKFWETEEPPQRSILSAEDERCEKHFLDTHSRADDGRYVVRLPFVEGPPIDIGDSRLRATKLLSSLSRRLQSHPDLASEYHEFLAEYERLGHMRKAPASHESNEQHVFIPHHPVVRSDSSTTRLRVVFNASCATSNGSTLNDHLMSGPKLQTELPAVILRWRNFKFVYAADIAKMYRQVRVDLRDVNYQRILWQPAQVAAPIEYQLLTVTYGMACAPYLALRVLQQLATDEGSHFPVAKSILKDNIYVDDVLFGGDDESQLRQTRFQLIDLLHRGGFELRKWASNSSLLLSDIESADHGLACSKTLSTDERIKILGVGWNPSLDSFQIKVALDKTLPESKRTILSAIAKLFDPLGWVTPVTITAKILMQQMWREALPWDGAVPSAILTRWTLIYSRLSKLNGLIIPRWTGFGTDVRSAELHGFADASNTAYAAVVYLKVVSHSGTVRITLLTAKSRVAPLKPLSIPRLELSAAVLLTQLLEFVRGSSAMASLPCFCWTDSTIVLAWISQHPSRWRTFVANRVADVQTRLPTAVWRHVSTDDNPADCASRGIFGDEMLSHDLWWHGPSWLRLPQDQWPRPEPSSPQPNLLEEKVTALHIVQTREPCELAARYSSWTKLIRVTAYVRRFISLCRRVKINTLNTESTGLALAENEFTAARTFWFKYIQVELFQKELAALAHNRSLASTSSLLPLRPFLDRDGVLRVGGRLQNAPIPFDSRHPILLASHPLVNLLVDYVHKRTLHAGFQLTASTLRREFWIIRSRSVIKARIHRCVVCVRERAAVASQLMGSLPAVRVTAPTRGFLHCGLDYAGPVRVRASAGRGITARKAYIALFVCLATRAIHLELVSDYTTAAFLNAYARFSARRGLPTAIYSDNGTTFVGADRELARAYRAAIRDPDFQNQTASDRCTWHFIPPSAPHFGGLWEAGVRSTKYHLRRILGDRTLTFEEFSTVLCNVEACLNSRPIAPLSDSLDDYDFLTPGHFLIGSAINVPPEPSVLHLNENRLTRWQLVRQITERFWKLWYDDYVNTLQQRQKWRRLQPSIKVGQIVLIKNVNLPPCKWEIGRVTQTHPGADGLIRVVTVRTSQSEYKRPIVKICVLPVDSEPRHA